MIARFFFQQGCNSKHNEAWNTNEHLSVLREGRGQMNAGAIQILKSELTVKERTFY